MSHPFISIITISYNSDSTIEETIRSVVSQDYDNFEYIIVDGGSSDYTLSIVDKYRSKITKCISEKDHGISDAFNKGIRNAQGEIIGIINSDDILEKDALKKIADYYSPTVDVYSGDLYLWDSATGKMRRCSPDLTFKSLKVQYKVCHPSRFIRKDAYYKWGMYDLNLRYKMDIDLLVRFFRNGARFLHIPYPLARFRLGGTTSDNIQKKKKDYYLFITNNGWTNIDFKKVWIASRIKSFIKRVISSLGFGF